MIQPWIFERFVREGRKALWPPFGKPSSLWLINNHLWLWQINIERCSWKESHIIFLFLAKMKGLAPGSAVVIWNHRGRTCCLDQYWIIVFERQDIFWTSKMPWLSSCCCGFSVRTGTRAIAILSLVGILCSRA